ncbi:MAG: IS3 family transposase [Bacteroidales bacterium]|uniref:IS3 family transposase n=1 Tax=Porphyromonas sp. TaxID=1924944 RepID=UPI00297275A7|nr:IS3 family transposase [Porphyromonas sp.]MDD7438068.1 IS3 family transposase [Bacteroidales bacterium]MDY3067698.1 IS3 family transposase [Porphyromonas sp.]
MRDDTEFGEAIRSQPEQVMDVYHTEHPTAGVVHMRDMLRLRGYLINEKRVRRLMRKMDILAISPQKSLTKGTVASYVHPYLLRGLKVERPNQVWSTDISYIPMEKGFMYLYAVIDVYSRFVVGWKPPIRFQPTTAQNL